MEVCLEVMWVIMVCSYVVIEVGRSMVTAIKCNNYLNYVHV